MPCKRKRGGGLEAADALQMRSEASARERARWLFDIPKTNQKHRLAVLA